MIAPCWDRANALRVLATDAGNDADLPGVFAATHRPVAGIVRTADRAPEMVEDASIVARDAIMGRVDHSEPIIMPVLGEPGTGKSHLVRWVWTWVQEVGDPRLCIVYIPRSRMNLGGVV